MAFEGLDISISGDSEGAKGAIASVRSSLGGLERSANSAQDSVEELGDEATQTSTQVGALGATAGASLLSLLGLSSAATGATSSLAALGASTGTVTVALVGLAAVAAPLVATVGALAAAGASLAAVFGGGIAAGVATHMEELKSAFSQARAEIMRLIAPVGELFGNVLVDAVEALPTLVENILNAIGPLEVFRETLVEFGELAMDIIPTVAETVGDLARRALPVLESLVDRVGDSAPEAFEAMMDVAEQVGDDLIDIAAATADLIPPLTETGVILIEALAPAVTVTIDVLGELLDRFNAIIQSERVQSILNTTREVLGDLAAAVRQDVLPVVRNFAEDALPEVRDAADTAREDFVPLIDEVQSLADEVRRTAAVLIPILRTRMGPAIDAFGNLAIDIFELLSTTISNAIDLSINALEILMALLRGDFDAALRNTRDFVRAYMDAVGESFVVAKDVIISAVDLAKDVVIGRFQTIADILLGEGVVDNITNSIRASFADLASWFSATGSDLLQAGAADIVEAIETAFDALGFGGVFDALSNIIEQAQEAIDTVESIPSVPEVDVPPALPGGGGGGGGGGSDDDDDGGSSGGGGSVGGGPTGGSPGGGDVGQGIVGGGSGVGPVAGLATGGLVEGPGAAMLHAGERVLPASQVSDRGEASFDPESVAEGFDNSEAVQELSSKLDRMNGLLSALDQGDVAQKDILRALDVAEDRRAGRDPFDT